MLLILCILLILMNLCVLMIKFIKPGRNPTCTILSALLYYFTLTAFLWKFFFALQQSFFLTNIFPPHWSHRTLFIVYFILTFSISAIPLLFVFINHKDSIFISSTCNYCWLTREFLIYGLIIPILGIICCNIVLYLYTISYLCVRNRQHSGLRSTKSNYSRRMQNFKLGLFFAIMMGFSWTLGFLILIPNSYIQVLGNILFCIVNICQGLSFSIIALFMLKNKSDFQCHYFWRYKNQKKLLSNLQNTTRIQPLPTLNDDDHSKGKAVHNSSIYSLNNSN